MTAHFPGLHTHKYMTAHFPGLHTHKYMTAHIPGLHTHKYMTAHFPGFCNVLKVHQQMQLIKEYRFSHIGQS